MNIDFIGSTDDEVIDATFSLELEDLGEFLAVVFSCGYFSAFDKS